MSKPSQAVLERQKKKITPCIRRRTTALRRFPLPQPSLVIPRQLSELDELSESGTPLSYAPTEIKAYGKHYILHEPVVCQAIRYDDDGYYSIRHDGLSIICGGDTWEEATREFNEWFVHNYKDFSAWDESHLGMFDEAFRLMKKLVKEEIDVEEM